MDSTWRSTPHSGCPRRYSDAYFVSDAGAEHRACPDAISNPCQRNIYN
jgi:hypothetical protein